MKTALLALLTLGACTYASTSEIPVRLADGSIAYRYEGRANFPHQIAEADRVMRERCAAINGGTPVVVAAQKRNVGMGGFVTGQATATGNTAFGTGMVNGMANVNQDILFQCVK